MTTLIIIIMLIGLISYIIWNYRKISTTEFLYIKDHFFNPGEKNFYELLRTALKNKYEIFSKVRMLDILKIKTKGKNYFIAKNKIAQKHIDFILCEPNTFEVLLAIELDGKMHNTTKQKEKDNAKDALLKRAGIPILRISTKHAYSVPELKRKIENSLSPALEPINKELEKVVDLKF